MDMKKFFDQNNLLWRVLNAIYDYLTLSLCWLVCCLPVITIGTSTIALYDTVFHCFRKDEGAMFKRFFRTFRRELGRGILITLLWAVIGSLLVFSYMTLYQMGNTNSTWATISLVYLFAMLIPLGVLCWVVTVESRFTYKFFQLHQVAFIYALGYLPYTLAIVAMLVAAAIVLLVYPFLIAIIPAVLAHLQSIFIEKVFKKYMPTEAENA